MTDFHKHISSIIGCYLPSAYDVIGSLCVLQFLINSTFVLNCYCTPWTVKAYSVYLWMSFEPYLLHLMWYYQAVWCCQLSCTTLWSIKTSYHFILVHNSYNSWWICTLFVSMDTWMNTEELQILQLYPNCVSTPLPDKTKTTKQLILKSVVAVFYYSTAIMSLWVKWAVFLQVSSFC